MGKSALPCRTATFGNQIGELGFTRHHDIHLGPFLTTPGSSAAGVSRRILTIYALEALWYSL